MQARHFPSNRYSLLSRIVRAVFDRGLVGWTFVIYIGPGPGYGRYVASRRFFIPTGWALWIGRNVKAGRGDLYRTRPWSAGITRHGNVVPYASH
jgi:hypothetical protein